MSESTMQNDVPQPLDPLRFPLSGRSLIEASAGTGKTFTIAMLYVRLVLGHDPAREAVRALTPPEILVVTFTDAATQELRDRIRARLTQAARCFQDDGYDEHDELLEALRDEFDPEQWPSCARRLQLAAEWMDEAAVSTIHAWCNRMLREHAFDSDSLFDQTLETDQSDLLAEVVRDYWRTFLTPLDAQQASAVATWASGPEKLQAALHNLIDLAALLPDARTPAEELDARRHRLAELKEPWKTWPDAMRNLLDTARAAKQYDGRKYGQANCNRWLQTIADWANDPDANELELTETAWERFSPRELTEHCLKGAPVSHEAFDALAKLREELDLLKACRGKILAHAARWVAARFADEQSSRAQMGFDDLLVRLDDAFRGANGVRLAEVIRKQFPVALIDEFQDTDPVQYRIFNAVYHGDGAEHALVMIGDPKQAIYAFRGADIHTYLDARRSGGTRLYTLTKNFRSTHAMVAAVNHCFDLGEARREGAFLFRGAHGNPVPFIDVSAKGRKETFAVDGESTRALNVWTLPSATGKPVSKTVYLDAMAASCATEMVRLLNLGARGAAGFDDDADHDAKRRALRPADMAVLVNNGSEARAIRDALGARGVRSVYLSDRESVFRSAQAGELAHWLAACAEPEDGRLVRNALATATLGLSFHELDALFGDEMRWEACMLQFRAYRESWRNKGVLPMLRGFLNDFHVPARLLGFDADARANTDGERVLTDLLHLAELLQHASTLIEGEQGLIRHLQEERKAARDGGGGDARQIRLESDGDLVKVITIHKSKGLEYPLVFLPFICAHRPVKAKDTPIKWHDDEGALHVAIDGSAAMIERADDERLGEDLRKLYVALTRARYATWIGMSPLESLERSAIGYLLSGRDALTPARFDDALNEGFGASDDVAVLSAPDAGIERYDANDMRMHAGTARTSARVVREAWWIASYSSLKMADGVYGVEPETRGQEVIVEMSDAEHENEIDSDDEVIDKTKRAMATAVHDFPRGSQQGSFLHDLLEWAAEQGFALVAAQPGQLREVIARRCSVRGWERWIDTLHDWMMQLIEMPFVLKNTSFSLSGLQTALAEMEFWFAAERVNTLELDRLVCAYTFDAAERPALEYAQLNGMLKGFMDLVFEHEGRFYVADYKSNWLGADDAHYTRERIDAQMLRSRYDLQMVLYLLALHRLLKARMPDYDYDAHVGGAVYMFVRGLNAPSQGVCAQRPPRELIERLDALFARGEHAMNPGLEIE